AKTTKNTRGKLAAVTVRRMPAKALLTEPATLLAVWYQAKAEATDFSPPCSAINAFAEGSRNDMDKPCAVRMAKSSHGAAAKPKNSETKLRRLMAATKVRFRPKRSAAQPRSGFKATATALLRATRMPT